MKNLAHSPNLYYYMLVQYKLVKLSVEIKAIFEFCGWSLSKRILIWYDNEHNKQNKVPKQHLHEIKETYGIISNLVLIVSDKILSLLIIFRFEHLLILILIFWSSSQIKNHTRCTAHGWKVRFFLERLERFECFENWFETLQFSRAFSTLHSALLLAWIIIHKFRT